MPSGLERLSNVEIADEPALLHFLLAHLPGGAHRQQHILPIGATPTMLILIGFYASRPRRAEGDPLTWTVIGHRSPRT
jgi:hypothetical protein